MRNASRRVFRKTRENQREIKREFDKKLHGEPLEVGDLVRVHSKAPPPRGITTKLLSRWRGPYEIVEKLTDKAYVVMMPVNGMMQPKVVNFRNLWRIGKKTDGPREAVETDGFFEEAEKDAVNEESTGSKGESESESDGKTDDES